MPIVLGQVGALMQQLQNLEDELEVVLESLNNAQIAVAKDEELKTQRLLQLLTLTNEIAYYKTERNRYQQQLSDAIELRDRALDDALDVAERRNQAMDTLPTVRERIQNLREQISALVAAGDAADQDELDTARKNLSAAIAEEAALENQLTEAENDYQSHSATYLYWAQSVGVLQEIVDNYNDIITVKEAEKQLTQQALDELTAKIEIQHRSIRDWEAHRDHLRKQIEMLRAEIARLRAG